MSFTMTRTVSDTFTLTQAKYLASKVTADMRRCQQTYGKPTDSEINDYGTELAILLRDGYVKSYEFGYVRDADDERILTWRYAVDSSGHLAANDKPGRIISGVNIVGASMRNYLTTSNSFHALSPAEAEAALKNLPIQRIGGPEYKSSLGYFQSDLAYSATGTVMRRETFKLYER